MKYPKINSIFKRNMDGKFIVGMYSTEEIGYLSNNEWLFDEKVDGTNIRIIWENGNLEFRGRTDRAHIPPHLLKALNGLEITSGLECFDEMILYGEGYGPKIQKGGGLYRDTPGFVLFDVKIGQIWLRKEDVEDIANKLSLDVVPTVGSGTLHDAIKYVTNSPKSTWGDFEMEGVIARPAVPVLGKNGSRIITKVKCRDFR